MSLKKSDTLDLADNPVSQSWGRLHPVAAQLSLPTYDLREPETIIGRNPECTIIIPDKRLSGRHCSLSLRGDKVIATDLSTNGTFINDRKIGKGVEKEIEDDEYLWVLPVAKVEVSQAIGFKIEIIAVRERKSNMLKEQEAKEAERVEEARKKEQELKDEEIRKELEAKKKAEKVNNDFAQSIKEQITCSFCYEIMCVPVSIQPCNHRFCGGCLTELVNSKKDTCIQCRKEITTAVRDAAFSSIIEDYLKTHPTERRDAKDEQEVTKKNIFGHEPINVREKIHGKAPEKPEKKKVERIVAPRSGRGRRALVRAGSDLSASDDEGEKCRECKVPRDGFRCAADQVHIACHTCAKLMAQRDEPGIKQCCVLCTTYFCNLYYPPCAKIGTKLQLVSARRESCQIDVELLRGNSFEFDCLRRYLQDKKCTSKDVFDYMLKQIGKGKFEYIFDKKIMKIPPAVSKTIPLEVDSPVCDICWKDLWFQMVFAYRQAIDAEMPEPVRRRKACYWGINCRTMDHNQEHAKTYNHYIYQQRF